MFDSLSDRLHDVLKKLRGESRLTDSNISEAMREIRTALVEADVNISVANTRTGLNLKISKIVSITIPPIFNQ